MWNIAVDDQCIFCHSRESRDHVFFECSFSTTVLKKLLVYLKEYHAPQSWCMEVEWIMAKGMGKSFSSRLRRLCFIVAIYHIWLVRNAAIF
ncbi:hypothetical protein LIER_19080 [Lithospermum erythrorhizon]|uniref:Reverse transcriptase zinc-binding domain-containing protein n=1 Tax=Lithospermum erythrorhizon TaxID=34254 RepID=A0AAV3QHD3_LITER